MELSKRFDAHLEHLTKTCLNAAADSGFDCVVFYSGQPFRYFADDQDAPFRPTPYFSYWCPEWRAPACLLIVRAGQRPRLVVHRPQSVWHLPISYGQSFWESAFEIVEVASASEIWSHVEGFRRVAVIGPETGVVLPPASAFNPVELVNRLDWHRVTKTEFELTCLSRANLRAAQGHAAARAAFLAGASELEIYHAFLMGGSASDGDLAYHAIVGLDRHAAVLHYEQRQTERGGQLLLLDAGLRYLAHCSDITRTVLKPGVPASVTALWEGVERLQLELCALYQPGRPFRDLQSLTHQKVAALLLELGIVKGCSVEAVVQDGLSRVFLPHGLGHPLGIQVHDVGGYLKNEQGERHDPDAEFPTLRTLRTLEPNQVYTCEPGIYFIPLLLEPQRTSPTSRHFNWRLIKELEPYGGVRIEDDLVVASAPRNLTRDAFAGLT